MKMVMNSVGDLLTKRSLSGEEVRQLNFIKNSPNLCFRKYYRQGLRSHIFEVLPTEAVLKEIKGEVIDDVRWFPRAIPKHVLRIMRTRFKSLKEVLDEIKKYVLVLKFLGPDLIATSNEFIVEYTETGRSEIVLCGLQEYVEGAFLDPWALFGQYPLKTLYRSRFPGEKSEKKWMAKTVESISSFVRRVRRMILDAGHIPDLAGNGNLILTKEGRVKLVDINNIIRFDQHASILIDDKGYPTCDKSVEVLLILEEKILKYNGVYKDPLYSRFLAADRKRKVKKIEEQFFINLGLVSSIQGNHETQ